jgi:hypothetical protein
MGGLETSTQQYSIAKRNSIIKMRRRLSFGIHYETFKSGVGSMKRNYEQPAVPPPVIMSNLLFRLRQQKRCNTLQLLLFITDKKKHFLPNQIFVRKKDALHYVRRFCIRETSMR